jgi:hypothetical protein
VEIDRDDDFPRALQTAAVITELHLRHRHVLQYRRGIHEHDTVYQFADVPPLKMGVSVDSAPDGPGGTGPCFKTGDAAVDHPADEAVDRERGIGPDATRPEAVHGASSELDDYAAHAAI